MESWVYRRGRPGHSIRGVGGDDGLMLHPAGLVEMPLFLFFLIGFPTYNVFNLKWKFSCLTVMSIF